jgi:hypothetical protein
MPTILAQAVKLLSIAINYVRSLPEGQQLPHLPIHQSLGNAVTLEGLLELIPSHSVPSLHRLEMVPPHQSFSPQLQSCEVNLVLL